MTKWWLLSETGRELAGVLGNAARAKWGRRGKLLKALQALADLHEIAAILDLYPFIFDSDGVVALKAAECAESIYRHSPSGFVRHLDKRVRELSLRGWTFQEHSNLATRARRKVERLPGRLVSLGLATCDRSGFVREAALRRLDAEINSGSEIPFLLLRLNDWVPSVRGAAEAALRRRLAHGVREEILSNLELVALLKGRKRIESSPMIGPMEGLLLNDTASLIHASIDAKTAVVKRYGLGLALDHIGNGEGGFAPETLTVLTQKADPGSRLILTAWLIKDAAPATLQHSVIPRLIDDQFFAVRRLALGWCAFRKPEILLPRIREALFDQSRVVRTLAQFHVRRLENADLRKIYVDAVQNRSASNLASAIAGLGETGVAGDAKLVLGFVHDQSVKVAKTALAALANLDLDGHVGVFLDAIRSPNPGISRQARLGLERNPKVVNADELARVYREARFEHVKFHALSLINRLPKWAKLPLLFEVHAGSSQELRARAGCFLSNWLHTYNRTHEIRPTSAELSAVRSALDRYGSMLGKKWELEFRAMARLG